jgi:hypothetical protein
MKIKDILRKVSETEQAWHKRDQHVRPQISSRLLPRLTSSSKEFLPAFSGLVSTHDTFPTIFPGTADCFCG